MNRKIVTPLILAATLSAASYTAAPSFASGDGIRGLPWGASAEQIRATDTSTFKRDTTSGAVQYLVYTDTYAGESISVVYRLIQNRLFEVVYNFESRGRKCPELSKKFTEVATALGQEYGTGVGDDTPSGTNCNARKEWTTGPTKTSAELSSDSGRTDLSVHFNSIELSKQAENVRTTVTTVRTNAE